MEKSCTHEGLDLNLCPYCEAERYRAEAERLRAENEALREENAQLLGYDNYAEQQAALAAGRE